MKNMNNKGMTTIEILVTFVIVMVIVISMYNSISNLNDRKTIASYKQSLFTYKDLLTKEIQDDLIYKQLVNVDIQNNKAVLTFKDGSIKELVIDKKAALENASEEIDTCDTPSNSLIDTISYNGISYPLPDLGSDNVKTNNGCTKVSSLTIDSSSITSENNIFHLKVVFKHPDFGTKYSIDIVSPINYQ